MKQLTIALLTPLLLLFAACTEAGGDAAPPGCTQVYSNGTISCPFPEPTASECCEAEDGDGYVCWPSSVADPLTLCDGQPFDPAGGSGSSGASTSGGSGSTSGGSGCTVDCPEPVGGVCGGYAEWSSGIMVWPIHRPNDANGVDMGAPASVTHQDPACAGNIDVCVSYEPPFGPEDEIDADAEQLAACNALTMTELNALGLSDTTIGQYGWTLVDHVCTLGGQLETVYQGQSFGPVNATSSQTTCLGDWTYEQYCSAADCPDPMVEGSTGAVDSSGGSGGVELEFDCSVLEGSDVDVDLNASPRTIIVRGAAADLMWDGPYTALYYCGGALINSAGKIHELERRALLKDWGLLEDDVIASVDGESSDMASAGADAANQGRTFTVEVKRGKQQIDYVIEVL